VRLAGGCQLFDHNGKVSFSDGYDYGHGTRHISSWWAELAAPWRRKAPFHRTSLPSTIIIIIVVVFVSAHFSSRTLITLCRLERWCEPRRIDKKRRTTMASSFSSSSTAQSSVSSLLAELYELSPNKDLFEKLRDGAIDTLAVVAAAAPEQEHKEDVPAVVADHDGGADDEDASSRRRVKVWSQTRDHLLVLLQRDDPTGLEHYIADSADQVMIYGECILALTATSNNPTNEDDDISVEPRRRRLQQQRANLRQVLRPFGTARSNSWATYRAQREWMCILLHELSSELTAAENLEWQTARASWTDCCRPGLIGHSFFHLGVASGKAGDVAKETHCYQMVVLDMNNNLMNARRSNNLRFEVWGIIYWHRRACEVLMEMEPAAHGASYQSCLDEVEERYPGVTFQPPSPAMIGPIALTYLSPTEYRKKLLREICATDCSDEALAPVCFRFDYCHEIDDLLFAVERHRMVLPILSGVAHLSYEPHIQETLDVLKSLDAEVSVA
jgi:hypothetical protein